MAAVIKKRKLNPEEICIFNSFHSNSHLLDRLEHVVSLIDNSSSGFGVFLSKIKACNAVCDRSFSNSTCVTETLKTEIDGETKEGFALSNIFEHGFNVLEAFIEASYRIPLRQGAKMALSKLLTYLSEDVQDAKRALTRNTDGVTDTDWSVMVAHHLLSKLSVCPNYLLDKTHCQWKHRHMKCTCGCKEKIDGAYGDTSIGVPKGWHGSMDIVMDAGVNVMVLPGESDLLPDEDNPSSESPADAIAANREKIRAQAINFSFLQHKKHPELENHLIPTIAVSRNEFVICLYDCVNDMLLETPPMVLLNQDQISKPAIIILWLTLNYKYFCSGVSHAMLNTVYKADFFRQVDNDIEKYRMEIRSPFEWKASSSPYSMLLNVINARDRDQDDVNCINDDPNIFDAPAFG